jgi:hypothetical protein
LSRVCSLLAIRPRYPACLGRATFGSPQFPSYPCENMPWSQTPMVTCALAITHTGLLPSAKFRASAFPARGGLSSWTTIIHFSGLNTEPAILLHPAPDSRCRFCPWISLMSCWLNFAHVGLSRINRSLPKQAPL